ncbi:hypothetical protein OC845_003261 [Tilletia horrida]|nr:hypothetical protein OC845_003261 [Tilletia horrida]
MSTSHVKLSIEPNPKAREPASFIQGYPGIPRAANHSRPSATITGVVHVRSGSKGIQAAWLRIELRKNETIPPGDHWAELIGRAPTDLWTAPGVDARTAHAPTAKSGRGKIEPAEQPQDWDTLPDASSFPFTIPVPEGLPPTARIDKSASITYELVATLCIQTKRGLIKKETQSSIVQATQLVVIEKHELHSMHPIYHIADEHIASTAPSPTNEPTSIVTAKVFRNQTCYGPGDTVNIRIIVTSDRISPVKLKNLSFAVRETITYRGGPGGTTKGGAPTTDGGGDPTPAGSNAPLGASPQPASTQKTEVICTKTKSIGKKMYKGDTLMFDLSAAIPKTHSLMSVATAKHIGVSYTMRIVVDLGGGDKAASTSNPTAAAASLNAAKENAGSIVMDHLPMTISNFLRSVSEDIVRAIGHVDGLSAGGTGGAAGLLRGGPDDPERTSPQQQYRQPHRHSSMDPRPMSSYAGGAAAAAYAPQDPQGGYGGGHPGSLRRSRSIDGSSASLQLLPSPTSATGSNNVSSDPSTPISAYLRRSDTMFSQRTAGTAFSGPGMAGRGVPGQLFDWQQVGGRDALGQQQPVRASAFVSGPGSIYRGRGSGGGPSGPASTAANGRMSHIAESGSHTIQVGARVPSGPAVGGNAIPPPGSSSAKAPTATAMLNPQHKVNDSGPAIGTDTMITDGSGPGGRALNQAELAALFHHTDHADSAAEMLGLDPTLFANDLASYSGFRANQKIRANQMMSEYGRNPLLSNLNPDHIPPSAPASVYSGQSDGGASRPPTVIVGGGGPYGGEPGLAPGQIMPQGMSASDQLAEKIRREREMAAGLHAQVPGMGSRNAQREQQQQTSVQRPAQQPLNSAHQRNVSTPVIRGPGPALHPGYNAGKASSGTRLSSLMTGSPASGGAGGSSPSSAGGSPASATTVGGSQLPPSATAAGSGYMSAEAEKKALYDRARSEAEQYQAGFIHGARFPPRDGASGSGGTGGDDAPAYTPSPAMARPQSMMELGGPRTGSAVVNASPLLHAALNEENSNPQQAQPNVVTAATRLASPPSPAPTHRSQGLPVPPALHASAYMSAESEKEQMRRFYEARDAVERHQAGYADSSSGAPAYGASSSSSGVGAGPSSTVSAVSQNNTTQLHRNNTAFFQPYESAPIPSYGKAREELHAPPSPAPGVSPLLTPLSNPHGVAESSVSPPSPATAPALPDYKGKGSTVIARAPSPSPAPQPTFSTSSNALPAPIMSLSNSQASNVPVPHQQQGPPPPAPGYDVPPPSFSPAPSSMHSSAISEKEQMRLYFAARDMQAQAEMGAGGAGPSGSGGPPASNAPGVISPTPGYAPGYAGRGGSPPPLPPQGSSQPAIQSSGGMPASRPPALPASLLSAAASSSSAQGGASSSGPTTSNASEVGGSSSGAGLNGMGVPSPSLLRSAAQGLPPIKPPPPQPAGAPQLPQFSGPLFSPMSFKMPPPGATADAEAGSRLSAVAMPRRAFEEANYTDEGFSAVAIPPPRPPKAASTFMQPIE